MDSLKGKLTEEEYIKLLETVMVYHNSELDHEASVILAKRKGYIKQTPLEEWEKYYMSIEGMARNWEIVKAQKAIDYLLEEIERLKEKCTE
jgi:hypothetical protein